MKARALFFQGALVCTVFSAVVFTAAWLWYDHAASGWGTSEQRSDGDVDDDAGWAECRYLSDTSLFLLKIVPASILAAWFVVSWIVFGREAFRLSTKTGHG